MAVKLFIFLATLIPVTLFAAEQPQTLQDIYNQALAHDANLASALSANKSAQELIEQSKSLYRPSVNFAAGANALQTQLSLIGQSPFPTGQNNFQTYSYGIDARQPLYRKQNLVQMEQAKTYVSQADKQLNLSQQALILRASQSYFEVLLAQEKIDLIAAQKSAISTQLNQAKAYFDAGAATVTDINEAQARYDLMTAQELSTYNDLQIAKNAVQAITGEIPRTLATVKTGLTPHKPEQPMEQWLEVATQNNLNIQIHQDNVKISTQEIERANAGHYPTLDAVAGYNYIYANGSQYGFGNELSTASVGVQLQVPLYQGGATSSRVRQAASNKQTALDNLDIAIRQTELETKRAYLNLNTSIAQITAYEQALTSSQSQVDSTKLGYDVGKRTNVDVLNAEQQLFAAKHDLAQARYSYLVNIIRLKTAAGVVSESDLQDINQQLDAHKGSLEQ